MKQPSFWLLIIILSIFGWVGITYYIRGEFYREKAKDYVGTAIATGVSEPAIMFRHILPNALTPVVSFAPFIVVANISTLVALDFLGFGLPTPSWGELIGQGTELIAHDLSVVRHISDRIALVFKGEIVEIGEAESIYQQPQHPYSRTLLAAVPRPDPERSRRKRIGQGYKALCHRYQPPCATGLRDRAVPVVSGFSRTLTGGTAL